MKTNQNLLTILIAEDDEDDYTLITDVLKIAQKDSQKDAQNLSQNEYQIHWVRDGEELIEYLNSTEKSGDQKKETPHIILLDLNMPKKDGREALQEIKSNTKFKNIPVIVLTTSQAKIDIQRAYDLGANSFIQKPFKYADCHSMMENCFKYWIHTVKLPS
jgi:CheY-like chemotaxis protein